MTLGALLLGTIAMIGTTVWLLVSGQAGALGAIGLGIAAGQGVFALTIARALLCGLISARWQAMSGRRRGWKDFGRGDIRAGPCRDIA